MFAAAGVGDGPRYPPPSEQVRPGRAFVNKEHQLVAREVEEETGYRAESVEHLMSFQPMVGMLDSPHDLYLVRPGEYSGEPVEITEAERLEWVPLARTFEMIQSGEIWNAGTLVALLYLLVRRFGAGSEAGG